MPTYGTIGQQAPSDPNPRKTNAPSDDGTQNVPGVPAGPAIPEQNNVGAFNPGTPSQGAGVQAQGVGTGFVNLQSLLAANAPSAQNMAQGLVAKSNSLGNAVAQPKMSKFDDGDGHIKDVVGVDKEKQMDGAYDAQTYARGLGNFGGLQAALQDQYKGGSYSGGQNAFDAMLTGNAGQAAFKNAQSLYGNLYNTMSDSSANAPPGPVQSKPRPAGQTTAQKVAQSKPNGPRKGSRIGFNGFNQGEF